MSSFEVSPVAPRDADVRRRWASAGLRSAALLVVPFACWLLLPAPGQVPPPAPEPEPPARVVAPPVIAKRPSPPPLPPPLPRPVTIAAKASRSVEEGVGGEVQDPQGEPISGAKVTCTLDDRELKAVADENGQFHFDAGAAGCQAVATASGFGASQPQVLRPGSGNRLHLSPPTGIAGNVVDEEGQPVARYIIGVDAFQPAAGGAADAGAFAAIKRSVNDVEGAFALTGLAPGHYELAVSVPLGPMVHSAGVDVAPGAMTQGVRIVVHQGVTVSGMVTDAATGAPIDGARAFVLWGGLSSRQPFTREGRFTLQNAPAGVFDLRVFAPGYALKVVPGLEGRPDGPPLEVDVALERDIAP